MEQTEIKNQSSLKKKLSYIFLAFALLYTFSPIDAVPDFIPVAGWADDFLINITAVLNAIQNYFESSNQALAKIVKYFKYITFGLGIIIILLIFLLGGVVYSLFT